MSAVLPGLQYGASAQPDPAGRTGHLWSAGKSLEAVEARIEAAFWEFDARHKGYSPFTFQRSERDAFKQTIRGLLTGEQAIP